MSRTCSSNECRDNASQNPHMAEFMSRVVAPLFNHYDSAVLVHPGRAVPKSKVKFLSFIRHAHGYHNLGGETYGEAGESTMMVTTVLVMVPYLCLLLSDLSVSFLGMGRCGANAQRKGTM